VVCAGYPGDATSVLRDRLIKLDRGLYDDVSQRAHRPGRQLQLGLRIDLESLSPLQSPVSKSRSDIAQPLKGEDVWHQRNHDVIACDQCGAVQRPEVRADINQDQVIFSLSSSSHKQVPYRADDPKSAGISVQACRPLAAQLVLKRRQTEVTDDQAETIGDLLDVDFAQSTGAIEQRPERSGNGLARTAVAPQLLEAIITEERGREIGLRIEVGGEHPVAALGEHPGEVVSQTGRADPALVVEEGDDRWVSHGEAMMAAADVGSGWC